MGGAQYTHLGALIVKAGGGTGEAGGAVDSRQPRTYTTHTHTHTRTHTHIPGMKQVFNKPLVDESINSWTKCE